MRDAFAQKRTSEVAIIDASVQSAEDAPPISPNFRFLPGDFIYATFQFTSFASKKENAEALPKISLQYAATLEDATGLPMAAPEVGSIDSDLGTEDTNWTPKRRVSFTLPSFIAAGRAAVHIVVKDRLGGSESSKVLPFTIGGIAVINSESVAVQNFQFFRKEDSEALDLPAFSAGDPVFAKFNITGFKVDKQNAYRLVYDVLVLRPDGKPYVQQPHAAELSANSFYPAQFLPATLQFTTSTNSAKGTYPVLLTIHDLIGNVTMQARAAFTLE